MTGGLWQIISLLIRRHNQQRNSDAGVVACTPVCRALYLKNMKRGQVILLILQMVFVAMFLYFVRQADLVMGKGGVGDAGQFGTFNKYAGLSFYAALILWVFTVVVSLTTRQFKSKKAQLAIGVAPVAIVVGWLLLWFI